MAEGLLPASTAITVDFARTASSDKRYALCF